MQTMVRVELAASPVYPRRLGLRRTAVATVLSVVGIALGAAAPAGAALSFSRTDYPLPNGVGPSHVSDVGPGYYDESPIALVDLRNNGRLDIAIADYGTGRVDVLLNQGDGTFAAAPGSPFAACPGDTEADDIVAGQLNPPDQNAGVAVACGGGGGGPGGIERLDGDGHGSLAAPQSFLSGSVAPLRLGRISSTSGLDYIFGGNYGYLCFIPVASIATPSAERCDGNVYGSGVTPVHFYDSLCFGGDELISFSNAGLFSGSALTPTMDPSTSCSTPFSTSTRSSGIASGQSGTSIAAADLNGDGEPDIAMADTAGSFHVMAWQGASSSFAGGIPPGAQPTNFTSAGPIYSLRIADFNGDGCPDIAGSEVLPSEQDVVAIHLGHCNTTQFDSAQTFNVAGDNNTNTDLPKMAVGDLNGDGKPDIVTTAGYAGAVTVLLNTTPAPAGGGGGTGGGGTGGGGTGGGSTGGGGSSRPAPNGAFAAAKNPSVNPETGAITFTESVVDPGTFSWLIIFQNGRFGVFSAAKRTKCKTGQVKLNGKCRPSKIVFGRGSTTVAAPGTFRFTVIPSRSAATALKNALKKKKGLRVTAALSYQSVRGGSPVSHTVSVNDKLTKTKNKRTASFAPGVFTAVAFGFTG